MIDRRSVLVAGGAALASVGFGIPAHAASVGTLRVTSLKFGSLSWVLETIRAEGLADEVGLRLVIVELATNQAGPVALLSGEADVIVSGDQDLLTLGTTQDARDYTKKLIDTCAKGGGYILANGAFFDEVKWENLKAIVDTVKEYGVYK